MRKTILASVVALLCTTISFQAHAEAVFCEFVKTYPDKFIAYTDAAGNILSTSSPVCNGWDCTSTVTQDITLAPDAVSGFPGAIPAGQEVQTWVYTFDEYAARPDSTPGRQLSEKIRIEYLNASGAVQHTTAETCDLVDGNTIAADNSDACVTAGGQANAIPKTAAQDD